MLIVFASRVTEAGAMGGTGDNTTQSEGISVIDSLEHFFTLFFYKRSKTDHADFRTDTASHTSGRIAQR